MQLINKNYNIKIKKIRKYIFFNLNFLLINLFIIFKIYGADLARASHFWEANFKDYSRGFRHRIMDEGGTLSMQELYIALHGRILR